MDEMTLQIITCVLKYAAMGGLSLIPGVWLVKGLLS